jgi:hypothetical protein
MKMWNSLNAWIIARAISIPMAIIIGLKPLFDGNFEFIDLVFPVFVILGVISHLRINDIKRK